MKSTAVKIITRFIMFVAGLVISLTSMAQTTQDAILTTGGNGSGTGGTVSYSVGQVVYLTNTGTTGSLAEGVQQPFEISTVLTGINGEIAKNISLSVFPNPTAETLTLQVKDLALDQLSYQLTDLQGIVLETKKITSTQTVINMSSFSSATYFILINQENQQVQSFKIIKN